MITSMFCFDSGYSTVLWLQVHYYANWIHRIISTVASVLMEYKKFQEMNFLALIGSSVLLGISGDQCVYDD